jgi:ankyrin repeat protein
MQHGGSGALRFHLVELGLSIHKESLLPNVVRGQLLSGILAEFPDLAYDCECGPISVAVLEKSFSKLSSMLSQGHNVNESNFRGQTPLHLAANWPSGMSLLLKAGADPNILDSYCRYALHYALEFDNAETVSQLLQANCNMAVPGTLSTYFLEPGVSDYEDSVFKTALATSKATRQLFFQSLAERRERLRDFLISKTEIEHLRLAVTTGCLDAFAVALLEWATWDRVQIPTHLQFVGPRTVFHRRFGGSLVEVSCSSEIADEFYELGFQDLSYQDRLGYTPFLESCQLGDLAMIDWLLKKGVTPHTQPKTLIPSSHFLAHAIRSKGLLNQSSKLAMDYRKALLEIIDSSEFLTDEHRHACRCACSNNGCNIATIFLRNGDCNSPPQDRHQAEPPWSMFRSLIGLVSKVFGESSQGRDLAVRHMCRDFARLIAFESLDIPHLCCSIQRDGVWLRHPDEVDEVISRNMPLLDHLDEMMLEYDSMVAEWPGKPESFLSTWFKHLSRNPDDALSRETHTKRTLFMPTTFQVTEITIAPLCKDELDSPMLAISLGVEFEVPDFDCI